METEAMVESPRLTKLQKDMEAENVAALESFWQEIREQGTPLIEPIADDNINVLVTFLWQAKDPTSNVRVLNDDILPKSPTENAMTRLLDTDLWYKSYRLRADLRFEYLLSSNDPELSGNQPETWQERSATWQVDPLNPKQYLLPDDEKLPDWDDFMGGSMGSTWVCQPNSLVELPAAPPQRWIKRRTDVPAGQVEKHCLSSTNLGNSRFIFVYTPPSYTTNRQPYDLLILFDGWMYRQTVPTPIIIDNLLAEDALQPLVAVLVDIPDFASRGELVNFPAYLDFLRQELIPWIRQNYHVTTDPKRTIVGGFSLSGVTAAVAALRYPDVFGNVLSQSGWFIWKPEDDTENEWVARQYAATSLLPLRFYMDVGTFEVWESKEPNQILGNRHFRTVLQAKGYSVNYCEYQGAHQPVVWQGTLADGLVALIGKKK